MRKLVAGIECHPGRRDRRRPMQQRWLHARRLGADPDARARVLAAERHHRPAIVGAAAHDVDFVAAARTVLVHPDGAGLRVNGQPLNVAVAPGEHFRRGAGDRRGRGARRRAAVRPDAHHRAGVVGGILRPLPLAAVAEPDHQVAVVQKGQPRAEVAAAAGRPVHGEHAPHLQQPVCFQPGARHGGAQSAVGPLRVGEVDHPVAGETGIQNHVEQAALPRRGHLREPGHRRARAVGADAQQAPRAFRDQQPATGQKRHRPRVFEPGHDRLHGVQVFARPVGLRLREHHRRAAKHHHRHQRPGDRCAGPSIRAAAHTVQTTLHTEPLHTSH